MYFTLGSPNHMDLIRVNGQGQLQWQWYSSYDNHGFMAMMRHPSDGTIWASVYTGETSYLYKFDIQGHALFGNNGVPYGAGSYNSWAPTTDGVITLQVHENNVETRMQARRVSATGTLVWQSYAALGGITPGGGQIFNAPVGAPDGADGIVLAFEDCRFEVSGNGVDISAQRVRWNGELGNPLPYIKPAPYQGPVLWSSGASSRISFFLVQAGEIKLELFDLLGRKIATVQEGYQGAGIHTVRFDHLALPSGIYLARLSTPQGRQVSKLMITR